jgi:hypothetical protein
MLFKNLLPTANKTHDVYIRKINYVMLSREIISVYLGKRTKFINTFCRYNSELLIIKEGGTYI